MGIHVKIKIPATTNAGSMPSLKRVGKKGGLGRGWGIGTLGYIFLLTGMIMLLISLHNGDQRLREVQDPFNEKISQIKDAALQQQTDAERKQKNLVETINREIIRRAKAMEETQQLEKELKVIEEDIGQLEATLDALKNNLTIVSDDLSLLGEGIEDLQKALDRLQKEKLQGMKDYADRYRKMKEDFIQRLSRSEPEILRQFYGTHQHTPFAPAALFFTAEKLYEKKRSIDAARLYADVVEKYPDSAYNAIAKQRLDQIQSRFPFEKKEEIGVIPYKVLAFVEK